METHVFVRAFTQRPFLGAIRADDGNRVWSSATLNAVREFAEETALVVAGRPGAKNTRRRWSYQVAASRITQMRASFQASFAVRWLCTNRKKALSDR